MISEPSHFYGGVGLRPLHYFNFLDPNSLKSNSKATPTPSEPTVSAPSEIQWLEVIAENYMDTQGRPIKILEKIRQSYPIAIHGVGLNLASPERPNLNYLARLKKLHERISPFIVSDHLCWTGHSAHNIHDLLPIIHNESTLDFLVNKLDEIQNYLGRPLALENVSAYIESKHSTYSESEFLVELCRRSGSKLLLDVNNIFVSEMNFRRDPTKYLDAVPADLIAQVHLAGFSDMGKFYFDTHSNPVFPQVWDLYQQALPKLHGKPTMIEWDEDIPSLEVLANELLKAKDIHNHFVRRTTRATELR